MCRLCMSFSRAFSANIQTGLFFKMSSNSPRRTTSRFHVSLQGQQSQSGTGKLRRSRQMEFTLNSLRPASERDRKSTRLNSSHLVISYAVFCLKKKNNTQCTDRSQI